MDTDTDTIPEPSLEDSIRILLMQVPLPVRDFVLNTLPSKTEELMARYQLHVDQGGVLERELLLMLLGQETPTEFVSALQEMGLDGQTIQALTNDVNTGVFMKLRETEERVGVAPVVQAPLAPPAVPAPPIPPAPSIAPPPPTPIYVPQPESPEVRTMQTDIAMMKSGMHPDLVPTALPHHLPTMRHDAPLAPTSLPIPAPPARPVMQIPVVVRPPAPPPPRVPQASQPPVIQVPPVPFVPPPPKAPAPQSENREALHQILKEYGVDPYREPPE